MCLLLSNFFFNELFYVATHQIGNKIMEASAKSNLKNVALELGGKSPLVVFDDANGKYAT